MTDEMTELTRAWYPRARVARVRASHSYGLVLALIVVSFVFMSVAPNSTWADSVLLLLQTITLVTALWTSGVARTDSTLSLGLVALAGLTALGLLVFGGNGFAGAVGILSGVVTVATIGTVALGVVDQGEANVRAVTGAVCVYVLIGLLFVFLATLGYGDYTPAGSLGRTLAIVEALFGQLYLVTVIAVLVSRMRRASPE